MSENCLPKVESLLGGTFLREGGLLRIAMCYGICCKCRCRHLNLSYGDLAALLIFHLDS